MGLFDFRKPKKNPIADLRRDPAFQKASVETNLEWVRKQAENLKSVGRADDVKKLVTTFLEAYLEANMGPFASPCDLATVSYALAYKYLPDLIYNHWSEFLDLWNGPIPFPIYVAIKGASQRVQRLNFEQVKAFCVYSGRFDHDTDYYMVQFPEPPDSLGIFQEGVSRDEKPSLPIMPNIDPYYLAALVTRSNSERSIYTLGQHFGGGTDVRAVGRRGGSCSCGMGPEPTPQNFLQHLRTFTQRPAQ